MNESETSLIVKVALTQGRTILRQGFFQIPGILEVGNGSGVVLPAPIDTDAEPLLWVDPRGTLLRVQASWPSSVRLSGTLGSMADHLAAGRARERDGRIHAILKDGDQGSVVLGDLRLLFKLGQATPVSLDACLEGRSPPQCPKCKYPILETFHWHNTLADCNNCKARVRLNAGPTAHSTLERILHQRRASSGLEREVLQGWSAESSAAEPSQGQPSLPPAPVTGTNPIPESVRSESVDLLPPVEDLPDAPALVTAPAPKPSVEEDALANLFFQTRPYETTDPTRAMGPHRGIPKGMLPVLILMSTLMILLVVMVVAVNRRNANAPPAALARSAPKTQAKPDAYLLVPAGKLTRPDNPDTQIPIPSFSMDRHEVTNKRYKAYMEASGAPAPSTWPGEGVMTEAMTYLPVTGLSREAAEAFCAADEARLPTEPEWEFAASAGDARIYPWSNIWDPGRVANGTHLEIVGSHPIGESPFGILDMIGNAAEMTLEPKSKGLIFKGSAYGLLTKENGTIYSHLDHVALLGDDPENIRKLGFRCVRDVSVPGKK